MPIHRSLGSAEDDRDGADEFGVVGAQPIGQWPLKVSGEGGGIGDDEFKPGGVECLPGIGFDHVDKFTGTEGPPEGGFEIIASDKAAVCDFRRNEGAHRSEGIGTLAIDRIDDLQPLEESGVRLFRFEGIEDSEGRPEWPRRKE